MANVIECKNKAQFIEAWSKSNATPAVQVGSKLPIGEHKATLSGFRIVEYDKDGKTYKISLAVVNVKIGKETIEDTGLVSTTDAQQMTPKKTLLVTTTPNPNDKSVNRNRVTLA